MLAYNEPLSRHTSFKVGGLAYCWAEPEDPDGILEALDLAKAKNKKFVIAGEGTNLLAGDDFFDGVIVHLAKGFEKIEKETAGAELVSLKTGAGLSAARLVRYAFDNNLTGCEFLTGIPGNIGGVIFMNAGVRSNEIKDIILDIEILDLQDRKVKFLGVKDINFQYRSSGLEDKIILGARFALKKGAKENIRDKIEAFNKKREWLVKIGFPNAGSVFKNPSPDKPAGMLIESCGLKGKRIGGAEISTAHANVIVNIGKATADDILALIDLARTSVKNKFNVELELELKII